MPMPSDTIFFYEKKRNAEGDRMKNKKSPERFSIRFDSSIPEHQRVIAILSNKGRNAARYIADAVIAYENCNKNSLESTVTKVVNKILGLNVVRSNAPVNTDPNEAFNFDDIADDLAGFKK